MGGDNMENNLKFICLRDFPELSKTSSSWFSEKWDIPESEYIESIDQCIKNRYSVPQWYVVINENKNIIAGAGVIENDFHNRKDLSPNICALFVEENYRNNGIAKNLISFIINDIKPMGFNKIYLVTDHNNFYENLGWEFLCMVKGDDGTLERLYKFEW